MSRWKCRNCGGGFPRPVLWQAKYVCPWCYEELARNHTRHGVEQLLKDGGER